MDLSNTVGPSPTQTEAPWAGDERDFLLWLSDTLREEPDPQVILCRMTEALGRRVGADTVGCAEVDAAVEYATISCEWLSGRIRGRLGVRHRIADYAPPELVARLLDGEVDIIEDVRTDPRLEGARRETMLSEGVLSHVSVPLVAQGRLRFIIVLSSAKARVWSAAEIAFVQEVAVRTWATLERARADAALQAAEQNQRFLVGLGDKLRRLNDPMEVLLSAAEELGRHLGVNRAGYAEVDPDGTLVIGRDWTDGTVKHGTGRRPIASFGEAVVAKLERGETERFDDATTDPRVLPAHRPAFEEMSIVAILTVPLVRGGRLVGMLSVHQKHPRTWTDAEVQLVQEVAERTWEALERARAELALRDSEQQFRMLANNIPALCWMADQEGRPFWFNRRWCEFFGVEEAEAAWNSSVSLDPQQASEVEGRWAQALERKEPFETTLALKGRQGFRTFLTRVEPMRGADDRVVRWFGMNTDVTEQMEAERNNAFLLQLGDKARRLTDPGEVLKVTVEMLGVHFGAARVGWAEVEGDGELIDVAHDWTDGVVSVVGRHPLDAFGPLHIATLRAGRTFRMDDARVTVDPEHWPVYDAMQIRSAVTVPLIKQDRFVALLSVHHDHTHAWTDAEVRLIEEVAERTWSAHEWARAEMGLRASEQQFRQMANNLPALCWMADPEGKPFWFNQRWCEYFGLSGGEETAAAWDSRSGLPPEMLEDVEARWAEALTTQEPFDMALPLRGQDGVLRTFLTRVEPMRDGDGRVVRWFGMNTDVTEQIEAERVRTFLLGLEDRLRPLLDPAEVIYAVAEELGRYLEVNRGGYAEVDGDHFVVERPWSNGEVDNAIGRYPINSFDPAVIESVMRGETFVCDDVEADPRISEVYRGAYSALEMRSIITKPLFKDGELVAIMTVNQRTPRKWTDAEARLVGEVGERAWASVARARAETSLRESERLLAAFMENAPVGMFLKEADGRYLLTNSGMERLFQRPAAESIGLTAEEVFPPEMADIAARQDEIARATGRAQVTYQVPGHGDGGWNLIIRFPIGSEKGDRIGGFVIDIDEQKRAEAELARSREALYQSEKLTALGSLLAGVSHELNNPLAVVVGQSMMLEEEAEETAFAERSAKIRRAAERCAKIVQTFLAMARQKPPTKTLVDANASVRGALDLTDYGLRTAGVRVETALDPDLPPLSADADQLHQVLANLFVNAQHALQGVSGPRELRVATRRGANPGTIEIEVADNGPGVPAEVRRRIFEPFFTTKPQGAGTGLGLSFSHGVIESHGGRIELLDREGGATFLITLPAVARPAARPEAATPVQAAPARGSALVIDDEPEIVDMLAELLRRQGYAVTTAGSGREGRARLEAGRFDVVLSDLRMPDIDGPALFDWIEKTRPEMRGRIGFITGDTLGPAASTFLTQAGRPYLEKPFTPKAVREFVSRLERAPAGAVS
jgi:PAS domain S-box-containing protein